VVDWLRSRWQNKSVNTFGLIVLLSRGISPVIFPRRHMEVFLPCREEQGFYVTLREVCRFLDQTTHVLRVNFFTELYMRRKPVIDGFHHFEERMRMVAREAPC
jgi:hypothetical protein